MANQVFNKGDFVKYEAYSNGDKMTFGIFEGVDLTPDYQYTKKYSLVLYYDSKKYCSNLDNGVGWGYAPSLDIARDGKECEKSIDTLQEDNWWKLCTPHEKEEAIEVLARYGYEWNEELLALVDTSSGEVVHKIIVPKIEYNGEAIKPICEEFKYKLKETVLSKNKTTAASSPMYGYRNGDYCDECWD